MIGVVQNFRRGRHTIRHNQIIIKIKDVEDKENAKKYLGYKVIWISPGKERKIFIGRITRLHGNKGKVIARFRKGLPGQILKDVVIITDNIDILKEIKNKIKEAKDINQVRKVILSY